MIVKIENRQVVLTTNTGQIVRRLNLNGYQSGDYNLKREQGVAVHTNGNVILFDKTGRIVRNLTRGASSAVFSGDDVVITLKSGIVELRRLNGSLIRTV